MLKNMSNTQAVICLERRKVMIDALEACTSEGMLYQDIWTGNTNKKTPVIFLP